ncbi:MAG: hypothetical protein ACI9W2_005343, partial [Gammaproteobacteria bacterium]
VLSEFLGKPLQSDPAQIDIARLERQFVEESG